MQHLMRALRRLKARINAMLARFPAYHATSSYSQEGEDMILRRIFEGQERGFYVDVGAHHPFRFSNTYAFYRMGWVGINIEPNPDVINLFLSNRGRDTNLQLGVSDVVGELNYYCFNDPALNTFDETVMRDRVENTDYKLVRTDVIAIAPLSEILANHVPEGRQVDFLTIDAEGYDLKVLQSNDWGRFRPRFVLVEALGFDMRQPDGNDIYTLMRANGYSLFARTFNTLFFSAA